jgi:hypothetical protein
MVSIYPGPTCLLSLFVEQVSQFDGSVCFQLSATEGATANGVSRLQAPPVELPDGHELDPQSTPKRTVKGLLVLVAEVRQLCSLRLKETSGYTKTLAAPACHVSQLGSKTACQSGYVVQSPSTNAHPQRRWAGTMLVFVVPISTRSTEGCMDGHL